MKLYIFAIIMLTSCNKKPTQFKLSSGETVSCAVYAAHDCGVYLGKCTNGKSYSCLTNVEQMPPEEVSQ